MLQLDDFFYCKPTNTCCMDLIFRNLFFCQRYFLRILNASNTQLLQYQGPILYQIYSNVTCSRSCDQRKITKRL